MNQNDCTRSLQNKVFTYLFPFVLSVFNLQKLIAQQSKFTHSDYMIKAAEFFANTAASNFSFLYFMDCFLSNLIWCMAAKNFI
ncbi:MAG: hypothetical protein RR459_02920 [Christensenellaceae bacterium]